ncbi:flippase [Thauera sp. WH-1]|uniref:flippase n=1 Tax=Thauera sp. WH-1 TaxID=3398230 RepID=UPI0039FBD459
MNLIPNFLQRHIAGRPNLVKILDNIGWLFLDKIFRMGIGLLLGIWIARALGPEQFGILSFATAFTALFAAIATLGLPSVVVRDIIKNPSDKNLILGTAAALQLAGGLIAYSLMIATAFWIRADDPLLKSIVSILGSALLFKFADTAAYWFESQVQSKYTVWAQNATFIVFAIVKVKLILGDASLLAFAWAILAETVLSSAILLAIFNLRGPKIASLRASWPTAQSLIRDSWPLLLSGIAIMVYMKTDQIMLGQMIGDHEVGIYSAAARISEVWYFIPMIIVTSVFPTIINAKSRSEELYYQRFQKLFTFLAWTSVLIALPMTFLSTPLIIVLYGPEYIESGQILAIHIWASVFVSLGVASSRWFIAENLPLLNFKRTAFGALMNIILNLALIPKYGAHGAALATVASQATSSFLVDCTSSQTRHIFLMKIKALNPLTLIKK